MRTYYLWALLVITVSCNTHKPVEDTNTTDYLIFGHFYGRCTGENCIETFKLTDRHLFEDSNDIYAGEHFNFVAVDRNYFKEVKDLTQQFPMKLLQEKDMVIGCPDCADGSGLLIEYAHAGMVRRWKIDQNKNNVPPYLHAFMDQVNEKIKILNSEK